MVVKIPYRHSSSLPPSPPPSSEGDPSAILAGRFQSFIEKSVRENSRGRHRLLRDVGKKTRQDGALEGVSGGEEERLPISPTEKKSPLSRSSEMTIRGWLGKRLFIAHIRRRRAWTLLDPTINEIAATYEKVPSEKS